MKKKVMIITACVTLLVTVVGVSWFVISHKNTKTENENPSPSSEEQNSEIEKQPVSGSNENSVPEEPPVSNEEVDSKPEITLKKDLTVKFLAKKKVSSLIENIEGTLEDDFYLDTTKVGKQTVKITYRNNENKEISYSFVFEVVDKTPPIVLLNSTYRVKVGSKDTLLEDIFCGDDTDSNPKCMIDGKYDLSKTGTYPVTFIASDKSGNVYEKKFDIVVYKPKPSSGSTGGGSEHETTKFSDVVSKHKNSRTRIGLDISKWQGDIDFDALKEAGVEFVMIRVGTTTDIGGDYVLDPKFKQNIENANRVGIDVGIYFYSYANTKQQVIKDANWVIEQIKDYNVSLPVAFDWEDWNDFNLYHVSFYELTNLGQVFLDTLKAAGYDGMLYSSKYYLETIWMDYTYETWLAHYTSKTTYKGPYRMWQLCSNGEVDGIKGDVDIDIWYLDEQNS